MACPWPTTMMHKQPLLAPQIGLDTPPITPEREYKAALPLLGPELPPTPPETPPEDGGIAGHVLHWAAFGLDKPLSSLLREATAVAHEEVRRGAVVDLLITGQIPRELHVRYLMMMHAVYSALEEGLAIHSAEPVVAYTQNAALLARADALAADIALLSGDEHWQTSELGKEVAALDWPELAHYVLHLRSLSHGKQLAPLPSDLVYKPTGPVPHLLLAHAYVRYMGDLSGGQSISKAVAKAYNLDGEGLAFYRFGTLEDPQADGSPSEHKRIKAWFRQGLDQAGELLTTQQKAEMMQEANFAFELNVRLFDSFSRLLNMDLERTELSMAQPAAHSKASTYAGLPPTTLTAAAPPVAVHSSRTTVTYAAAVLFIALLLRWLAL